MKVTPTALPEVLLVEPDVFADNRGHFFESYHDRRYAANGIREAFVQDNVSFSVQGVLRGLHFQYPHGQGKLVSVLAGEVYDVAVDVRYGSPTFRRWVGVSLSAENRRQLFVPSGFAHGFVVVTSQAVFSYKCTDHYDRQCERIIRWDDPSIGITWPLTAVVATERDQQAPMLDEIPSDLLPRYETGDER